MSDQPKSILPSGSFFGFDLDEIAYIAPMISFLLIMSIGTTWPAAYPWAYVGRALCAAVLIRIFWKQYTTIRWNYWWLGILMGILGIVQWIGMDLWLQQTFPSRFALDATKAFNPTEYFTNPISLWAWIAVRMAGASLVVPVMEELFWRDYLWRRMVAPADFKLAKVGEWDKMAFWVVAIAFCVVHPQWLTAIVWGLMIGGLLAITRSLGACIIMHAVTNLLLGLYVLKTHQWQWW